MDLSILWWLLALALVLVGLAGLILPVLPGAVLVLAGLVLAAWIEDFQYAGAGTIAVLSLLTVVIFAVDFIAGSVGAKRFGASPRAAIGAAIGAVLGMFLGPIGLLLGPFAGAVIGELSARRGWNEAGRAGIGATIGLVIGSAAKLGLAFSMIGVYLLARVIG
jgi:uncharacterized protein